MEIRRPSRFGNGEKASPQNCIDISSFTLLFPRGVAVEEHRPGQSVLPLLPEEMDLVRSAAPRRIRDFSAGRHCARLALSTLGFTGEPLLAGTHREPLWPTGTTGSITHTDGLCAAVAAKQTVCLSLGVDAEKIERITDEIWPQIRSKTETVRHRLLPDRQAQLAAALTFSAKEAFFKCQFPILRQWIEFQDVTLSLQGLDSGTGGTCMVESCSTIGALDLQAFEGRWVVDDGFVLTGFHNRP